jgi:5-methylcytosine-specific restriction endonuclease McrA
MNDTLVLDSNWTPVGFVSWERAVKLWYEDRAKIIKEDEAGKILRSQSFEMGMPRVIVVKNSWARRQRLAVPCSRRNIAVRDNSECQYCGKVLETHEYTLDHVVPRSKGGLSTWVNLVLACVRCNKNKGQRSLKDSGMTLLSTPVAPKPSDPRFNFKLHITKLRPEWKEWSSWLYWNVTLDE